MTSNDPFGRTDLPAVIDTAPAISDKTALSQCVAQIEAAWDDIKGLEKDAFSSAIALGFAAGTARDILPKGEFMDWHEKNFGKTSKRTITIQWVRRCINAAEVSMKLERNPKRAAIMDKFNTVEKLGGILSDLIAGVDVLALTYGEAPAKQGRPPKVQKLVRDDRPMPDPDLVEDVTPKSETTHDPVAHARKILADGTAALDAREKRLDAKEKRLQEWEDDLTRRAALIQSAEPNPIEALKAAKLANDAKVNEKARRAAGSAVTDAPRTPTAAATSAAKGKRKGVVAPEAKIAPETVAAIQDAAQRAVPSAIETLPEVSPSSIEGLREAVANDAAGVGAGGTDMALDPATASAMASLSAGHPVNVNEVL